MSRYVARFYQAISMCVNECRLGHYDRLPALAADLVGRKVSAIVATAGTPTIQAAKAATSSIPIVFVIGGDPVRFGIVASLSRPGGNITGITLFGIELATKRLELLLELVPAANMIGVLANQKNPISEPQVSDLRAAARKLGRELVILKASADDDFVAVSAALDQKHVDALVVAGDPFFDDRRAQIVSMTIRQKVPSCYVRQEFVREGGLISYGADVPDAFRQAGTRHGFSRERSLRISRSCSQLNSSWPSTLRPQKPLA